MPLLQRRADRVKSSGLGAALATVAAARLAADGITVQGVYTYGSPRVGNETFINQFPVPSNTWRFVHHRDLVTTLPPAGFYGHVGHLRQITSDGRLLDCPEPASLRAQVSEGFAFVRELADIMTKDFDIRNIDTFPVPFEALADHAPIYYANRIWNLQV
jgi:triacylglycerol lipase